MKAVGLNTVSSRYAGINTGKTTIASMIMSGALAGLAGASYYLGYYASIQPNVLSSTGFDSIAVALLGNSHPIGVIFSSLLITALSRGGTYMSSIVGIRQEISSLIVGIILLFSACGSYIRYIVDQHEYKSERGQS
jgi:simple sugar transport system permease protein